MSRGMWWSLLSTVCTAGGSLLITPILVHTLGALEFGIYSLVIAFASYFGLFDLGLTWAATRYFTEDLARADSVALTERFRTLQIFFLGIGVACIIASIWIGPPMLRAAGASSDTHTLLALVMGTAAFTLALQIQLFGALLRAAQHFAPFGRAITLGSALLPLGSYAMVRLGQGLLGLLAVNLIVNLVVLSVCWSFSVHTLRSRGQARRFDISYLRQMLSFGGWSTLSRVVMIVMLQMDRLAVALIGQVSGLTYYAVPASVASRINVLAGPATSIFFARASSLYAEKRSAELMRQHARAFRFLLWSGVALGMPLIMAGPAFLSVWIGPEMAQRGGLILIVFAVGYSLTSIASLDAVTIEASGRAGWTATNMLLWCAPVIVGVASFAGRYGIAAIAFGIAAWQCGVAFTNIILCRRLGIPTSGRSWLGTLVTASLAFAIGNILRPYVTTVGSGLAVMSAVSLTALAVGSVAVLSSSDRTALVGFVSNSPISVQQMESL